MADGAPQPAVKKRMLRIASGCATREAFVAVFRRFCDRESIFIATRTPKQAGADLQFSITLADGVPLIGGTGTVLESWSDETSPYGRAGMRIRFDEVSPNGRALIDELVAAGKADAPPTSGVPKSAAAAALAALAKAGPTSPLPSVPSPPPTPTRASSPSGSTAKIPAIKPLPSVISKATDGRSKTMLGMTPLKRPAKLEATPAPVAMPMALRDVEMKLPPPPARRAEPTSDEDPDEQITGVAAKFTPDTAFPDEASWDEAASHALGGTRVKGSDLILPANPLGGVDGESLDAFVECTIYEETGSFTTDSEATAPGNPPDDWHQDDLTIPPWLQGPLVDHSFNESMAVPPPLLPLESEKTSTEKRHHLVEAGKAFVPAPEPVPVIPRRLGRNHWPLTIGLAVVTGLAGVAIGYFAVRSAANRESSGTERPPVQVASAVERSATASPTPAPAEPAPTPAAPEVVTEVAEPARVDEPPPPEPEPAAADPADKPAAADPADKPAAADPADKPAAAEVEATPLSGRLGKDRCGAEIKSRDGTEVFIGERKIGETPLRVVLPCGEHQIELRRSRYANLAKTIDLTRGKLEKVELNLSRPEHKLKITSVPGGAAVKVNGRSAGTTPATVTVNGFEQARVSVELSGYRSWSTRVYVREPTTSVSAKLTADKPAAKPAPKPSARPGKASGSRAASSQPSRAN